MASRTIEAAQLLEIAGSSGLSLIGVASLNALSEDERALKLWQQQGYAGQMGYMERPAEQLSNPSILAPFAASAMSIAIPYQGQAAGTRPLGFGRVARYAWGADYHKIVKELLHGFVTKCEQRLGLKVRAEVFCDAVPLLERALAKRAALGFIGKNTNLIRPELGSFFFLGEILWDVEVQTNGMEEAVKGSCGVCARCRSGCPSGAIFTDYVLDARKCISYLTIEKKGNLTWQERLALGEWVFGCDVCQEVCPFNHAMLEGKRFGSFLQLSAQASLGPWLDLGRALSIRSNQDFKRCFAESAFERAGRAALLRNCAVVAANTHAHAVLPHLLEAVEQDPSMLVRRHALWALYKLGGCDNELPKNKVRAILEKALLSGDDGLMQEAQDLLNVL